MKALLATAAAAAFVIATPAFAQAGPTSSVNADADATIVTPIHVSQTTGLNFGSIAAIAGTVTVGSNGASTSSPNMLVPGVTPTAGLFAVTGEPGLAYSNTVAGDVTLTNTTDSNATMSATLSPSAPGGTLSTTGTDSFTVGGVLTVADAQKPGSYSGTYSVSVQYN